MKHNDHTIYKGQDALCKIFDLYVSGEYIYKSAEELQTRHRDIYFNLFAKKKENEYQTFYNSSEAFLECCYCGSVWKGEPPHLTNSKNKEDQVHTCPVCMEVIL